MLLYYICLLTDHISTVVCRRSYQCPSVSKYVNIATLSINAC